MTLKKSELSILPDSARPISHADAAPLSNADPHADPETATERKLRNP
jgi:hypothetical protein